MTKSKCYGAGISGYGGMTPLGSTKIDYYCGGCGKPCELVSATDTKPETDEKQRNKADNDWADRCAKDHSVTKQEETFYACLLRAALAEGRRRQAAETAQREEAAAREAWEASSDNWIHVDDGDGRFDSWQGDTFEDWWKQRRGAK